MPPKSVLNPGLSLAQTPPVTPYCLQDKLPYWALGKPAINMEACGHLERLSGSWAQTPASSPLCLAHPWVPTGPKRPLLALSEAPAEEMAQFHSWDSARRGV